MSKGKRGFGLGVDNGDLISELVFFVFLTL